MVNMTNMRSYLARSYFAIWIIVISGLSAQLQANTGARGFGYGSYKGILAEMQELKARSPDIIDLHVAGNSTKGLPIFYASILGPKNKVIKSSKKKRGSFLLVGGHHGDEIPSIDSVVYFLDGITRSHNREWLHSILTHTDLHFVPSINPDGYAKQQREQSWGIDINRDYYYPGRNNTSFKSKESRVMKSLLKKLGVSSTVSLHSGMEAVLWPYGFKKARIKGSVGSRLPGIAAKVSKSMGFGAPKPMFDSYPTYGSYLDFAYTQKNIAAITIEISQQHNPPRSQWPRVLARAGQGLRVFLNSLHGVSDGPTKFPVDHRFFEMELAH